MKYLGCIRKLEVLRVTMEVKEEVKPIKLSIEICFVDFSKLAQALDICRDAYVETAHVHAIKQNSGDSSCLREGSHVTH